MIETKVKEKPILFKGEMIRAILDGRKTQTRRVVKGRIVDINKYSEPRRFYDGSFHFKNPDSETYASIKCPYGKPGGNLWIRETWLKAEPIQYKADGFKSWPNSFKWKPSIHMPRTASRINLEIIDIRVERVQDITEDDAKAEGVPSDDYFPMDKIYCPECNGNGLVNGLGAGLGVIPDCDCTNCDTFKKRFKNLWDSINEKRGFSWKLNLWVWVIEFKRID